MSNNRESYSSPANDQVTGSGMFLRLNQDYIPEFRKYKAVVGSQKDRMYKCGREVQSMQLKTAGEIIEIDLP